MPEEICAHRARSRNRKRIFGMALLIILLIILIGGGIVIGFNSCASGISTGVRKVSGTKAFTISPIPRTDTDTTITASSIPYTPTITNTPTSTNTSTRTNTPTTTNSRTIIKTPTFTHTPTISKTPSRTPAPRHQLGLEVRIGLGNQFLIHKVLAGESLEMLARRYDTTVEAINAVNLYIPIPLWENTKIIIPIEITDPKDLPPFESYMVVGENIRVDELAQALSVDANALAYYNALEPDYILVPGDWLLIPRARYTPTP